MLNVETKKSWFIAACAVLAMTIISCGTTFSGALEWLKSQQTAPPQIDMTGLWDSSESVTGTWGLAILSRLARAFQVF